MMNGMPLAAPSGTTATAISISQIDISWQDRSNNESGSRFVGGTAPVS
jgi:hypothetical protein